MVRLAALAPLGLMALYLILPLVATLLFALATHWTTTILPEGFTFVRAHRRGRHVRRTVYRSASALAILSDAAVTSAEETYETIQDLLASGPQSWLAFERLIARLLDRWGIEVLETRSTKDGGVDIMCEAGDELVAVQCKFYAPDRPVGEKEVRDLAGVLKKHPEFSRAMLVTTSTFTAGAIRFAVGLPIELIDLLGLRRLLSETDDHATREQGKERQGH